MKKTEKKTLTDAYVKRIKTPQTGRKEYFDALVPGFGVRVINAANHRSARSWILLRISSTAFWKRTDQFIASNAIR